MSWKDISILEVFINMELCIDTSTRFASVALSEQGKILRETTWRSARNHSVELVPSINYILNSAGKTIADVTAVITARGLVHLVLYVLV